MRLDLLDPHFVRLIGRSDITGTLVLNNERGDFETTEQLAAADGLMFLCPVCFKRKGGPIGCHQVICWRPHVPQTISPVPGRWEIEGTGYGDLTLVAGSSSVLLTGGCNAHFFVRAGEIVLC